MSQVRLLQRIQEVSKSLKAAHEYGDTHLIEQYEDELLELQEQLEEEEDFDYESKHNKNWS